MFHLKYKIGTKILLIESNLDSKENYKHYKAKQQRILKMTQGIKPEQFYC